MKYLFSIIYILSVSFLFGQNKVGINTSNPEFVLDVRGVDDDLSGGEMQLATPSSNHFLRFFGGRGFDPMPFLLFSETDTFRIASSQPDYGKFTDLITVQPQGNVGIGEMQPDQKLVVDGKLKIGNDNEPASEGSLRFKNSTSTFEGYDGVGWVRLDNKLVYQDKRLSTNLGDTKRNLEQAWGDTITIAEDGNYMLFVSAYFSSTINEQYAAGTPSASAPLDNRGRLKIYVNGVSYKLLECGNGIIDRNGAFYHVQFAPGTRSFMEVISFNAGDKINLTRNMQAIPATIPNLTIPDLWLCSMDAFYIMKLD